MPLSLRRRLPPPRRVTCADFNREFAAVAPRLRRVAEELTGDPREAERLLRETFLSAFPRYEALPAVANFQAWTYRIMHALHAKHLRYGRRRAVPAADSGRAERSATAATIGEVTRRRWPGATPEASPPRHTTA